jgi:hypothetical protein
MMSCVFVSAGDCRESAPCLYQREHHPQRRSARHLDCRLTKQPYTECSSDVMNIVFPLLRLMITFRNDLKPN